MRSFRDRFSIKRFRDGFSTIWGVGGEGSNSLFIMKCLSCRLIKL